MNPRTVSPEDPAHGVPGTPGNGPEADVERVLSAEIEATLARCAGVVRSIAARRGLDEADVDEVFQDVRLRLWKSLGDGETIRGVSTSYVYRTASSAALDLIRRRRRRPEIALTPGVAATVPSTRPHPERAMERADTANHIERAIQALMESRRPAVRMYLAGYRVDEIARVLGWTSGKARNLLYRGLTDLREILRDRGFDSGDIR